MKTVQRRVIGPNGTMTTMSFEVKEDNTELAETNPELPGNFVGEGSNKEGDMKPLEEMTVKELKNQATGLGLKFKSTAKKAELIELLTPKEVEEEADL